MFFEEPLITSNLLARWFGRLCDCFCEWLNQVCTRKPDLQVVSEWPDNYFFQNPPKLSSGRMTEKMPKGLASTTWSPSAWWTNCFLSVFLGTFFLRGTPPPSPFPLPLLYTPRARWNFEDIFAGEKSGRPPGLTTTPSRWMVSPHGKLAGPIFLEGLRRLKYCNTYIVIYCLKNKLLQYFETCNKLFHLK